MTDALTTHESAPALLSTQVGTPTGLDIEVNAEFVIPQFLGRYKIHGVLGRGGMGVVYAATDPELDRDVALKVLSPGDHDPIARARLRREARTLAKLAHPNVVTVHDVGETHGQLYIAMERIAGQTLRAWTQARRHSWSEIVDMYAAAGRGLIAAHEAGLVHRDFKPDNVLVDERGIARVVDFGLARLIADPKGDLPSSNAARTSRIPTAEDSRSSRTLTRTGTIMGTPAYMAPEQHLGLAGDAQSDQFALCVAIWEALYGVRPFVGLNHEMLASAILRGELNEGPGRGVPPAIRRVLRRGLATAPEHRWPSVAALLTALTGVHRRRRNVAFASLALVLTGSLVAGTWYASRQEPTTRVCVDTGARVDHIWNPKRRTQLNAALTRVGGSEFESTRTQLLTRIEQYADTLRAGFEDACLDTRQRLLVSPGLHDKRLRCLATRMAEFDARVGVLETMTRDELGRATTLLVDLPQVERCADLRYLEMRLPGPSDPADARRVDEARSDLARAKAAHSAARFDEGEAELQHARRLTEHVDFPPLTAEMTSLHARFVAARGDYREAATLLENAYYAALGMGHDEAAIEAALQLIYQHGFRLRTPERAFEWARHAESLIERSGDEHARAQLSFFRGPVHLQLGEPERALQLSRHALAQFERLFGPDDDRVASALTNIGGSLEKMGRHAEARVALERALAIRLKLFGDYSAKTATTLGNLGLVLEHLGEHKAGIQKLQQALEIYERVFGPADITGAGTRLNLTYALFSAKRMDEALQVGEQGLRIARALDPPRPVLVEHILQALAEINLEHGQPEAARARYLEMLVLLPEAQKKKIYNRADPYLGLARLSNAVGEFSEALAYAEQALEIYASAEEVSTEHAEAHSLAAQALRAQGQPKRAKVHAQASHEIEDKLAAADSPESDESRDDPPS